LWETCAHPKVGKKKKPELRRASFWVVGRGEEGGCAPIGGGEEKKKWKTTGKPNKMRRKEPNCKQKMNGDCHRRGGSARGGGEKRKFTERKPQKWLNGTGAGGRGYLCDEGETGSRGFQRKNVVGGGGKECDDLSRRRGSSGAPVKSGIPRSRKETRVKKKRPTYVQS